MGCYHNENRKKKINYENEQKQNISKNSFDKNELKIELYPKNLPKNNLKKKSIKNILSEKTLAHSLDKNKDLAYLGSNVPLLDFILLIVIIIL